MNFLFVFLLVVLHPVQSESVDHHLTFTYNDEIIETVDKTQYINPFFSNLFLDEQKVISLMDHLEELVYEAPTNATMDEAGQIIPEIAGSALDRALMNELIVQALYEKGSQTIEIPIRSIYPKVTSELLSEISFYKINEYVTYYKETNIERSHNIKLATEAINNYVLFPGERFSFNQVVGKRTKERGYLKAPVIVRGELSEDIGGGICQVSSTLYNAVILKGIQIVERYSHSREVPYVPPGKDATVSWWGPDFVIKNTYHEPIFIRASAKNGNMRVQIFSSEYLSETD